MIWDCLFALHKYILFSEGQEISADVFSCLHFFQKKIFQFLPYPPKSGWTKDIKALYYLKKPLISMIFYFADWTTFLRLGQKLRFCSSEELRQEKILLRFLDLYRWNYCFWSVHFNFINFSYLIYSRKFIDILYIDKCLEN